MTISSLRTIQSNSRTEQRIYSLEEIVVHPEVFEGNYNTVIGTYLLAEGNNERRKEKILNKYQTADFGNNPNLLTEMQNELNEIESQGNNGKSPFETEAYNQRRLNEILSLCKNIEINVLGEVESIKSYLADTSNYSLEGFIEVGKNLENSVYSQIFENKQLRDSLIRLLLKKKIYSPVKNNINFNNEGNASYRNIRFRSLFNIFPCLEENRGTTRTIIYEAIKSKNLNVTLPNWFSKTYIHLLEFIRDDNNIEFTTSSFRECGYEGFEKKYLHRALREGIEMGLIKRVKRGHYKVIRKSPNRFTQVDENVKNIVNVFNQILGNFHEAYGKLMRDGFLNEQFRTALEQQDISIFNNNQEVFNAFEELNTEYQDITSLVLKSPLSFNNLYKSTNNCNRLIKNLGQVLINIQTNPKQSKEKFEQDYQRFITEMDRL